MGYIEDNKAAWEEAFENRKPGWGDDNHILLDKEEFYFFNDDMKKVLERISVEGKTVAQFCCNNGRELLSVMKAGAGYGVGVDIAENLIGQAKTTAEKAGITNCCFDNRNVLDASDKYANEFDLIFFTIGAITWLKDLNLLFKVVADCLKSGGILIINDFHPLFNMLPTPDEAPFDEKHLDRITYPYFEKEPWAENTGMSYMSVDFVSKTPFTSSAHTISDILNALIANGMKLTRFDEFDYDLGLTDVYDNKGYPLSFILVAEK